jgi:hypothetical protein
LRVEGSTATTIGKQPCGGFSLKDVFDAFLPVLAFHGIVTMNQVHARVKHCRVNPAEWMMLYMDKIHAVYRDRGGTTWLEEGEADPVAMTVAALAGTNGAKRHHPSDAARELFIEIMADRALAATGHKSRWSNKTSGHSLALELTRRKGARGKLKTNGTS